MIGVRAIKARQAGRRQGGQAGRKGLHNGPGATVHAGFRGASNRLMQLQGGACKKNRHENLRDLARLLAVALGGCSACPLLVKAVLMHLCTWTIFSLAIEPPRLAACYILENRMQCKRTAVRITQSTQGMGHVLAVNVAEAHAGMRCKENGS